MPKSSRWKDTVLLVGSMFVLVTFFSFILFNWKTITKMKFLGLEVQRDVGTVQPKVDPPKIGAVLVGDIPKVVPPTPTSPPKSYPTAPRKITLIFSSKMSGATVLVDEHTPTVLDVSLTTMEIVVGPESKSVVLTKGNSAIEMPITQSNTIIF